VAAIPQQIEQELRSDVTLPPLQAPRRRRFRFRPTRALRYLILTALAILFIAPMAYMVTASLQPLDRMFAYPPQWFTLHPTISNYINFFKSGQPIARWVANSAFVSITTTVLQLFVSSMIAYTFAKRTWPGRDILFFMGLATMMLPTEVTLIPNYLILKHIPLFGGNNLAGIGGHGWLDSYWGLIAPNISSAFSIFLLRQYMRSIPDELIDAARVDGAGHFRIYWKIILPLSKPALAALAIFTFQGVWSDFYGPLIIISSPDHYTLPLGLALFQIQNRTQWDLVTAGSVLALLPIVLVFFVFQRQFVRGISLSGMKA
jgi:multiple sugar transport system permease protein